MPRPKKPSVEKIFEVFDDPEVRSFREAALRLGVKPAALERAIEEQAEGATDEFRTRRWFYYYRIIAKLGELGAAGDVAAARAFLGARPEYPG